MLPQYIRVPHSLPQVPVCVRSISKWLEQQIPPNSFFRGNFIGKSYGRARALRFTVGSPDSIAWTVCLPVPRPPTPHLLKAQGP